MLTILEPSEATPRPASSHILNQPTVGVGSPAGDSGTTDRGTVGPAPVGFSSVAGLASLRAGARLGGDAA